MTPQMTQKPTEAQKGSKCSLCFCGVSVFLWCALVLGQPSVQAFGFDETPTQWPAGSTIEFVVNMAGVPEGLAQDQYVASLRKALEAWRAVQTVELPFAIGPMITDAGRISPKADGTNMIFWKPGFVARDQYAGKAYPYHTECDILLSPKPPFTLLDVQATVMHELGHCMGLAHSTAASVMTKFQGLPSIGYDDTIALALLYPRTDWPLKRRTATLKGKVVLQGDPLSGALVRVIDVGSSRVILAGFSGLVNGQRRKDPSGRFELPGLPPGQRLTLRVEPMDDFTASDPPGYGAPVTTRPPSFHPLVMELPELDAGDVHDAGTLTVLD